MDLVTLANSPLGYAISSGLAVLLTSALKKCNWPRQLNGLIAFSLAFVLGLIQYALQGDLSWQHIDKVIINFGVILASGQSIYHTIFKDSALDKALTGN